MNPSRTASSRPQAATVPIERRRGHGAVTQQQSAPWPLPDRDGIGNLATTAGAMMVEMTHKTTWRHEFGAIRAPTIFKQVEGNVRDGCNGWYRAPLCNGGGCESCTRARERCLEVSRPWVEEALRGARMCGNCKPRSRGYGSGVIIARGTQARDNCGATVTQTQQHS